MAALPRILLSQDVTNRGVAIVLLHILALFPASLCSLSDKAGQGIPAGR